MPPSNSPAPATPAAPRLPAPERGEPGRPDSAAGGSERADVTLVARMAQCDEAALAEFYDQHGAVLYSLAVRMLHDARAAEQAVQEAMTTIWDSATDYAPALGCVIGWAIAITRRVALAHRRSTASDLTWAGSAPSPTQTTANTPTEAAGPARVKAAAARVREALDHLQREQRAAIEMTFFGGLNQTELAAQLGVPLTNVRTLLRHAMMTLRDATEGQI